MTRFVFDLFVDFFRLFGVKKSSVHDINIGEVDREFKRLQKILHPDKFSLHSKDERGASAVTSSTINQVNAHDSA